jgi:hypothetical protein
MLSLLLRRPPSTELVGRTGKFAEGVAGRCRFSHPHESVERAAGAFAVLARLRREGAIVSGSPAYAELDAPVRLVRNSTPQY